MRKSAVLVLPLFALTLTACGADQPAATPTSAGAVRQDDQSTAEIVRWMALPSLTDEAGDVQVAKAGTRFVNVEVQFHGVTEQTKCTMALVTSEGATIALDPKSPQVGETSCQGRGADPVVSSTFVVPSDKVEAITGISLDPSNTALSLPRP